MVYKDIQKAFKKGTKLNEQENSLRKKFDKLYKKFSKIAYKLQIDFLKDNLEVLNKNDIYYKLYFENNYVMVEELYFKEGNNTFLTFSHKSEYRKHISVTLYIDLDEEDYDVSSAVVDSKQLQHIASLSKIITRK